VREPTRTAFHELGPAEYPFGRADQPSAATPPGVEGDRTRGCGSVLRRGALCPPGSVYEREELDYRAGAGARSLRELNPLGQ